MIECTAHLIGGPSVPAIKLIRSGLNCGLKEAKDLHDSIRDVGGVKRFRMTFAQYGAMQAHCMVSNGEYIQLSNIEIVTPTDVEDLAAKFR